MQLTELVAYRIQGSVPSHSHWCVPRGVDCHFTGREDSLDRLNDAFFSRQCQGQRRYVISGLGGTGKSEVSLRFASIHREKWVFLTTPLYEI